MDDENWTYLDGASASVIEVSRPADGGARITIGPRPGLGSFGVVSVHADERTARDLAATLAADPEDYSTPPRIRRALGEFRLGGGVDPSVSVWRPVAYLEILTGPPDKERVWRVYLRGNARCELAAYLRA